MKKEIQYHSLFCKYSYFKIFIECDKRKLKKYLKRKYGLLLKNIKINEIYIEEGSLYIIEMKDLSLDNIHHHDFIYIKISLTLSKIEKCYVFTQKYGDIPKNTLKIILEEL